MEFIGYELNSLSLSNFDLLAEVASRILVIKCNAWQRLLEIEFNNSNAIHTYKLKPQQNTHEKSTARTSVCALKMTWNWAKNTEIAIIRFYPFAGNGIMMLSLEASRTGLFMYLFARVSARSSIVAIIHMRQRMNTNKNVAAYGAHQFANVQNKKEPKRFSPLFIYLFSFLCYLQHSFRFSCAIKVLDWAIFATFFGCLFVVDA